MRTKASLSVSSASAAAIGVPYSVASGLTMTKLSVVSASMASVLVWKNSGGMPGGGDGAHTESATADWLSATATTSASTSWLAQSVAPAGSAPVSQVTTSMRRPPMPPLWLLQYSAVASADRNS